MFCGSMLTVRTPTRTLSRSAMAVESGPMQVQSQQWMPHSTRVPSNADPAALLYASCMADSSASIESFTIDSNVAAVSYEGKLWSVQLRLHDEHTVDGELCSAKSDPVTGTKVTGIYHSTENSAHNARGPGATSRSGPFHVRQ